MMNAGKTFCLAVQNHDKLWMKAFLDEHWGDSLIVSRGQTHQAELLPGFIMVLRDGYNDRRIGLVTYAIQGDQCEVVSLNSLVSGLGVGTRLLLEVEHTAQAAGCKRLWLITTNDNTQALRFYQTRGWRLAGLHRDAIKESRRLKPGIPEIGLDGIPILDEIELEKWL